MWENMFTEMTVDIIRNTKDNATICLKYVLQYKKHDMVMKLKQTIER